MSSEYQVTKRKHFWIIPILAIAVLMIAFLIYAEIYYQADQTALDALKSDAAVTVTETDYGWFFDGPSDSDALVFYPGGKVEETAYAPLLHSLADKGMDVCLVRMPFRLAVFGANKADGVMEQYSYENWYIGGHSLGGAMAANYAADHSDQLKGLIMFAAYPTKELNNLQVLSIYGSEDGVLNREKYADGKTFFPEQTAEYVIEGGNHAQFGNYGEQSGDGTAAISAEKQQELTVDYIIKNTVGMR